MSFYDRSRLELPSEWYDINSQPPLYPIEDRLSLALSQKDALINYSERDIVRELIQNDRVKLLQGLPSFLQNVEDELKQNMMRAPSTDELADEVVRRFAKIDLAKALVRSNKQLVQVIKQKRGAYGTSGRAGPKKGFPSRASQPHMYKQNGQLKDEYLTLDHEGLEFVDPYTGETFVVEVNPVPEVKDTTDSKGKTIKVTDYIDRAMWVKSKITAELWTPGILYKKDKLGRPLIGQLNYEEHHGLVMRAKDGKLHQVHCVKKSAKGKEDPSNCKMTKDGRIMLKWGAYDKKLRRYAGMKPIKPEFVTPFGRFSYDELMKLPMDKVLQMLIILELFQKEGQAKNITDDMIAKGMLPPGREGDYEWDPVENKFVLAKGGKRKESRLTREQKQIQEKYFRSKKVPFCTIKRPHRCYSEAYSMAGLCVTDPKKCFEKKYYPDYRESDLPGEYSFLAPQDPGKSTFTTEREISEYNDEITREMLSELAQTEQGVLGQASKTRANERKQARIAAAQRAEKAAQEALKNAQELVQRAQR